MTSGEPAELGVGVLKKFQDGLVEIIAACDHAVHVVFLVLDRAEQERIFQVHHFRHAPAMRAKEFALGGRGAVNFVIGSAKEFAEQIGFGRQVGALGMGGEHAVLDVHTRVERQFVDLAENDALVGCLLGVLGDDHRPASVERGVEIVVAAMDVEGVLGEGAGADFEHHGGELAGRVIVLLHGVSDALAGGEIDRALAADRVRRGAALRGMFTFGFDRDFLMAPDVQFTRRIGALVNLAALSGGRDGVKDAALGDAGLDVLGHQEIAVAGDADAGIFGGSGIGFGRGRAGLLCRIRYLAHRHTFKGGHTTCLWGLTHTS